MQKELMKGKDEILDIVEKFLDIVEEPDTCIFQHQISALLLVAITRCAHMLHAFERPHSSSNIRKILDTFVVELLNPELCKDYMKALDERRS